MSAETATGPDTSVMAPGAAANVPAGPGHPLPEADVAVQMFRQMLRIRRFEERCVELYSATKIRGFLHLYIGEEAVATGVMRHLEPQDAVVATYREHGHALIRGHGNALVGPHVVLKRADGYHERHARIRLGLEVRLIEVRTAQSDARK